MVHPEMEDVYKNLHLNEIPWNHEEPPQELVKLVENKIVLPCRAVDIGCGAGNYSVYLARQGFDVTGIDLAPTAIKHAQLNARRHHLHCTFLVNDMLSGIPGGIKKFDFALEWGVLHGIQPEERETFVGHVAELLNPGATYLAVCFHETDVNFGGSGKYRKTRFGHTLYFSSKEELELLYQPLFEILDNRLIDIGGDPMPHRANYILMKKR